MNATPTRALVIAGGGAAGNAWAIGVAAGLDEAGIDLTQADLVVGTSSGSTVAAQITQARPADLYAEILTAPTPPPRGGRPPHLAGPDYMTWSQSIVDSAADVDDWRRKMCAAALERDTAPEGSARWRATVAARLPGPDWPQQDVKITALNARTAEPIVFDRDSGIDLVDAVAASTSNGFTGPYRIGDDRYLNGAYRRSENADLAAGYDRVLILVPFGGRSRTPPEWGLDLTTQVKELRDGGSEVHTIFPTDDTLFDANALDPATRPPAAKIGHAQGRTTDLAEFWTATRA